MGFGTIAGTTRVTEWDAPVTRAEAGGGYLVTATCSQVLGPVEPA
jgi:hypothetical protein